MVLTIVTEDGEIICSAHKKRVDYSVIVTERGQRRDTEYGNVWEAI